MGKLTAGGQPAEGEVARAERAKLARQAIQVQAHADEAGIGRASDPARKLRLPRGGKAPYTSRNRLRRSCRLTSAPALMTQSRFQCAHNHPSLVTPIDFILGSALESPGTRGWYNFRETAGTHRGHANMFPAVLRTPSSASVFLSFPAIPVRPRTFTAVTRVQIPPGTPTFQRISENSPFSVMFQYGPLSPERLLFSGPSSPACSAPRASGTDRLHVDVGRNFHAGVAQKLLHDLPDFGLGAFLQAQAFSAISRPLRP